MNKNGFLLAEETLKLILAVISLGFLAYLLVSLYFSSQQSKELEQAKETLPFLMNEIGQGKITADIYNPKDWYFLTWSNDVGAPQACSFFDSEGCICLCEENTVESCDETKICLDNQEFLIEDPIKIEEPPITLNINYGPKQISKEE